MSFRIVLILIKFKLLELKTIKFSVFVIIFYCKEIIFQLSNLKIINL
jgi:hypothetical protein